MKFCPNCGWPLKADSLRDIHACGGCAEVFTGLEIAELPELKPHHGQQCEHCDGTGLVEVEFTERHPYGDTYAEETLTEDLTCEECNGRGYHLDETTCIVCGLDVKDGILVEGWEVHEDGCSTDHIPTLEGWD